MKKQVAMSKFAEIQEQLLETNAAIAELNEAISKEIKNWIRRITWILNVQIAVIGYIENGIIAHVVDTQ